MNKWSSFIYLNWQDEEINTKIITVEDATYVVLKRNPEKKFRLAAILNLTYAIYLCLVSLVTVVENERWRISHEPMGNYGWFEINDITYLTEDFHILYITGLALE